MNLGLWSTTGYKLVYLMQLLPNTKMIVGALFFEYLTLIADKV